MTIPRRIAPCKPLHIKDFSGDTRLISELPAMHGENFGTGASYGASADAGMPVAAIPNRGAPMTRHTAILTNLLLSLPLATGLLCATANASAQTSETVTIPFAFSADPQQVPAGTYEVRLLSSSFLSLYNLRT